MTVVDDNSDVLLFDFCLEKSDKCSITKNTSILFIFDSVNLIITLLSLTAVQIRASLYIEYASDAKTIENSKCGYLQYFKEIASGMIILQHISKYCDILKVLISEAKKLYVFVENVQTFVSIPGFKIHSRLYLIGGIISLLKW